MGWGSATELFDGSVDVTLDFLGRMRGTVPPILVRAVVEETYRSIDWCDWDTQYGSKYHNHLIHIRYEMGEVDKDEYDWYLSSLPDE